MGKPPEVQGSEEGAEARGVVPASDADRLRRVFLAVLALGGVVLVGAMLRPFLPAILIGMDPGEVTANLTDQAREVAGTLATRTIWLFSGLGGWFLQTLTALFTIYYLLRDGDALAEKFKDAIPMERKVTERLMSRAAEVSFAAVFGSLLVAGSPWKALALLVLGLAVISSVDNVLRAVFVGNRAQLHPLVVFFSVLGGLVVFGGVGIFVGPVLFVTALTLMEMARLTLDPPDGESPGTAILP